MSMGSTRANSTSDWPRREGDAESGVLLRRAVSDMAKGTRSGDRASGHCGPRKPEKALVAPLRRGGTLVPPGPRDYRG